MPRGRKLLLVLLLAAQAAYAARFVALTSVVVEGRRYFTLFDDAMVSMRYARNLARGEGLVWNAGGERVEGFTNPGWTLFMAGVHLLGLPPTHTSLAVQVTAALLLLLTALRAHALADRLSGGSAPAALGAAFLTAFYLPLNTWALQGMEVALLALVFTEACLRALSVLDGKASPRRLYLLMAAATLVRLDAAVLCLAVLAWLALFDQPRRRAHLAEGLAVLAAVLALQTAARLAYYGEALPNTYTLKMTGYPAWLRIAHGLKMTGLFLAAAWPLALILPWAATRIRRRPAQLLPVWVAAAQLAYSVYVGGDAWEWAGGANRYVSPAVPALFAALAAGVAFLAARLPIRRGRTALTAGLLLASLVPLNDINRIARPVWTLREPSLHVRDNAKNVRRAVLLSRITLPGAKVAVTSAGTVPYFADRQMIDLLGKNDRRVARGPAHDMDFHPGHVKWDYGYSIGELQPDLVLELWLRPEEAEPYLSDYSRIRLGEFLWWMRRSSPQVLWGSLRRYR